MASPSFRSVILSASFPSSRTVNKFVRFLIPQPQGWRSQKASRDLADRDDLGDAGSSRPRFVKIDVEGAAALLPEGMRRTLAEVRPVVFVECSEAGRERS